MAATQVSIDQLSTWLANKSANTVTSAYEIEITGLTENNVDTKIGKALRENNTKYVNLSATTIPEGITLMDRTFINCSSLVYPPVLPSTLEVMQDTFSDCSSLKQTPLIPESVIDMHLAFTRCTSLENVRNVPKNVTNLRQTFSGCTALKTVELFEVPLENVDVSGFEFTFAGCTALEKICVSPMETEKWHIFSLKNTGSSTSIRLVGNVYDSDGTSHEISTFGVGNLNKIILPVYTDELWFPDTETDAEVEQIILDVLQNKCCYYENQNVLAPSSRSFVLQADDPSNFVTNLPIGNNFQIKRLKDADCSTVGNTYSLDTGEKFSDWDFIIPIVSTYDSSDKVFEIIPKAEIEYAMTQSGNSEFTHIGTVSGTTRRMSWSPKSDTTFTIGHRDGTSSHLPHLWGFYGVKFG